MPYAYALQVSAILVGMGIVGLAIAALASWQFDRNTRKIEARKVQR